MKKIGRKSELLSQLGVTRTIRAPSYEPGQPFPYYLAVIYAYK